MHSLMTFTFKRVVRSTAVESFARELGQRLSRCHERIHGCHCTVETHPAGTAASPQFMVTIHLRLPWAQIHADNILPNGAGHADLHGALREAYDNARRQLDTFTRTPVTRAMRTASRIL